MNPVSEPNSGSNSATQFNAVADNQVAHSTPPFTPQDLPEVTQLEPEPLTPLEVSSLEITATDEDTNPENAKIPDASSDTLNIGAEQITSNTGATLDTPTTGAVNPMEITIPTNEAHEAVKKSQYFNNSIFWIENEKIIPNPYQPRKEFDAHALRDLAESIRMYGLLQPLVVTRKEIIKTDGGLAVRYELISGERRLRASKLAGLTQVPVIIRAGEEDARVKLELAIIENLQREDLNPLDRARSFERLSSEFHLKHVQIAEKVGKSREYVTNSIRLLALPEHMLNALSDKKITEGHTRPLLMLIDRPAEQEVLFKEITSRKMTVREAERHARGIAVDRARKHDVSPELRDLERQLKDTLGTRVIVEKKDHQGGKIVIDFWNDNDVRNILERLLSESSIAKQVAGVGPGAELVAGVHLTAQDKPVHGVHSYQSVAEMMSDLTVATPLQSASAEADVDAGKIVRGTDMPIDDSTAVDKKEDEDLYSIKNFSI